MGTTRYLTSGNPAKFTRMLEILLGEQASVSQVFWRDGELLTNKLVGDIKI
jgi:hypothetical protein